MHSALTPQAGVGATRTFAAPEPTCMLNLANPLRLLNPGKPGLRVKPGNPGLHAQPGQPWPACSTLATLCACHSLRCLANAANTAHGVPPLRPVVYLDTRPTLTPFPFSDMLSWSETTEPPCP